MGTNPPYKQRDWSRRHLLGGPIPALASSIQARAQHHIDQAFSHPRAIKQLLPADAGPEGAAQARPHGAGVQRQRHRAVAARGAEMAVECPDHLVDASLGRAIRVPAAQPVVGDAAHARGHYRCGGDAG